jgi:hypothetical protein
MTMKNKMLVGQANKKFLIVESNLKALGINHFDSEYPLPDIEEIDDQVPTTQIDENFFASP